MPVLVNEPAPPGEPSEPPGEGKRERVPRLIGFKVVRAVFAYSDTAGLEIPSQPTPGREYQHALATLGIRESPFDDTRGNLQGYSVDTEIAINPMAVQPTKTRFHEMAHIVLGHTLLHRLDDYQTHRGISAFQAEAVAYLCMNEVGRLDDDTARTSRGYIQHWLDSETPPDKAIQQVFTAADRILKAGRIAISEVLNFAPNSAPNFDT